MKYLILLMSLVMASVSFCQDKYEFNSYLYHDLLTNHKNIVESYALFTFSEDSISIEMETYDGYIMHFNYAITAQKKESKFHYYFETERGFQFYLDKRKQEIMVVHQKSNLASVYY